MASIVHRPLEPGRSVKPCSLFKPAPSPTSRAEPRAPVVCGEEGAKNEVRRDGRGREPRDQGTRTAATAGKRRYVEHNRVHRRELAITRALRARFRRRQFPA
jgi:hypothetical protein